MIKINKLTLETFVAMLNAEPEPGVVSQPLRRTGRVISVCHD
jgi:hypothetical protein